jgi:hypothetical protein
MLPPKNCFKPLVGVICRTGIVDSLQIKRSQYIFRMTPSELADIFSHQVTFSV